MSLGVYLNSATASPGKTGVFVREDGQNREITREEWDSRFPGAEPVTATTGESNSLYSRSITHNLGGMAKAAGIYDHLWRPDEIGVNIAADLISPLAAGLTKLRADPDAFKALNPPNGWGNYEGLVAFVDDYLAACRANPTATVYASR